MWPLRINDRGEDPPAECPVPDQRPTTLRRSRNGTPSSQKAGWSSTSFSSDRTTSTPRPSERSLSATKCCAFCSCPGRLGICTSRCRNVTSSSRLESTAAAILWVRSGIAGRSSYHPRFFRICPSVNLCMSLVIVTPSEAEAGRTCFSPCRHLPCPRILRNIRWRGNLRGASRIRNRRTCDHLQRYHSRPRAKRVILFIINRRPLANLRGKLRNRQTQRIRRLQLSLVRVASLCPASGQNVFGERTQSLEFFCWILHHHRSTQNDHRPVIHRVIEDRPRQHQSIQQRDRNADGNTAVEIAQHATGGGAVNIQIVARTPVGRRNHERLPVDVEANLADETFVKNFVNRLAIVDAPVRFAHDAGARAWGDGLRHEKRTPASAKDGRSTSVTPDE